MAELFMECEEEELEPWQQKSKPIIVDDDDDDDDEPIFVGEILSSKPASTYILNRDSPGATRVGLQNGAPKRGAVPTSPGFQPASRPAASTLAVQPQPRVSSLLGTAQVLQRPLSGCPSPQEAAKSSASLSQPMGRPATAPALSRNLNIPVLAQSASRPVATVTAQPVMLNRGTLSSASGTAFALRQSPAGAPCQSGSSAANATSLPKRPATSDASSVSPKKAKAGETGSGSESPGLLPSLSLNDPSLLQKGATSSNDKNGAPFPQACPKCNIHFNLLEPLKNHVKYCCPEMVPAFLGGTLLDRAGSPANLVEAESGKLIMLVNDFYYGKHEGNLQQVRQEQKTHTTYKCASCTKLLKSNIRFMNHMKHHLELEKQNSESWESHTTCQHCYRQFPTPFQLQCHIESTHTPHESSTICKICELSFETEQVLLQHMKDNHKPGEMPYVCQVCSYRSSAFSDVEKHFRAVHENTKNLLCPFCLKVIKIGLPYVHHFMRHQKKGVHRCTKCRLQFLTGKEKMDHKSQHHRTFKKPPQLEGLPPGTKVTIRASVGSLPPAAMAPPALGANASALPLSPVVNMTSTTKSSYKGSTSKTRSKAKPLGLQKKQSLGGGNSSSSSSSSSSTTGSSSRKNIKIANTSLNNLKCPDIQKCIECYSDIRTFASHFPAYVRCSLCRYSTSCSKAYVNHMVSFHSARQSKRFWIYKTHSEDLSGMTVVCLNCEFLTDASGMDQMAAHLNDNDTHTCQIIVENVPVVSLAAADLPNQSSSVLLNHESGGKSQKRSRPSSPEEQTDGPVSRSSQIEEVVEAASQEDPPGKPSHGAASLQQSEEEQKPAGEEGSPSAAGPPGCAVEPAVGSVEDEGRASPGVLPSEEALVPKEEEENPWPATEEEDSGAGPQGGSAGGGGGGDTAESLGGKAEQGLPAAEREANPPLSTGDDAPILEPLPCSEGSAGEGIAEDLGSGGTGGLLEPEQDPSSPSGPGDPWHSGPLDPASSPGGATKEGDTGDAADQGLGVPAAACEENTSLAVLGDPSCPGASGCTDDEGGSGHEGVAQGGGDCLVVERDERGSPSVPERSSSPRRSPHSGDPVSPAEGEGEADGLVKEEDTFPTTAEGGEEEPPPPAPEALSPPAASSGPADPAEPGRGGDGEALGSEVEDASLAAEGQELPPTGPSQQEAPLVGTEGSPRHPSKETAQDRPGGPPREACEWSPSAPAAEEEPGAGGTQASSAESSGQEKATPVEEDAAGGVEESTMLMEEDAAGGVEESSMPVEEEDAGGVEESSMPMEESSMPMEESSMPMEESSMPMEEDAAGGVEESSMPAVVEEAAGGVAESSMLMEEDAAGGVEESSMPMEESSMPMEESSMPMEEDAAGEVEESSMPAVVEEAAGGVAESSMLVEDAAAREVAESSMLMEEDAAGGVEESSVPVEEEEDAGRVEESSMLMEVDAAGEVEESSMLMEEDAAGGVEEEESSVPVEEDAAGGVEESSVPGGDTEASCQAPPKEEEEKEAASDAQAEGAASDEAELVDVKVVSAELTSDEAVSFEQFLSRNGEPVSATSDTSEQGSVHLEPLTPSEVLEHEATEILQKGGAAAPSSSGAEAEEAEAASSREGSPAPDAAPGVPAEGSDEAS